jgi:TIR domain
LKPFDIFICHKKSSGKDFAEHLKSGLEELGYHSFLDSKDIPKMVDGKEEWMKIRDNALKESKVFILIITPGFDLSPEVIKEIELARKLGKQFIYFRHRDLARKIIIDLQTEKVDLGKQEQVSFETKEELLRLTHNILLKNQSIITSAKPPTIENAKQIGTNKNDKANATNNTCIKCEMCANPIEGQIYAEQINGKTHHFDSKECAKTYKKLKSLYGENFE